LAALVASFLLVGCAERSLPEYEAPLKRSARMKIRTTAYTHTESDHIKYAASSALGTPLQSGSIRSAAGDWARWPVGTKFMIVATGQFIKSMIMGGRWPEEIPSTFSALADQR